MSIAALIRRMAELGAPAEAIALAVEAIEAEQTKDAERRARRAEQKAGERASKREHVARQSHDNAATVAAVSHDPSPPLVPPAFPPAPPNHPPYNPPTPISPVILTDDTPKGGKGHRLPADWMPKPEATEYGAARGLTAAQVADEAEAMRDWALSNANRGVARKADWDRTFLGWLRRAAAKPQPRAGPSMATGRNTWDEFKRKANMA